MNTKIITFDSTVSYVLNNTYYPIFQAKAKKDPSFRRYLNQPINKSFELNLRHRKDEKKLDTHIKISSKILLVSRIKDPEAFSYDKHLITWIFERIIKFKKFKRMDDSDSLGALSMAMTEFIENSAKEILEIMAREQNIKKLTNEQFHNEKIRMGLYEDAKKARKYAWVIFEYNNQGITFKVVNNTHIGKKTEKSLKEKALLEIGAEKSLGDIYKEDEDEERIGAGIGYPMAKMILDGLAKGANCYGGKVFSKSVPGNTLVSSFFDFSKDYKGAPVTATGN